MTRGEVVESLTCGSTNDPSVGISINEIFVCYLNLSNTTVNPAFLQSSPNLHMTCIHDNKSISLVSMLLLV